VLCALIPVLPLPSAWQFTIMVSGVQEGAAAATGSDGGGRCGQGSAYGGQHRSSSIT
jgi:hypothetical protein